MIFRGWVTLTLACLGAFCLALFGITQLRIAMERESVRDWLSTAQSSKSVPELGGHQVEEMPAGQPMGILRIHRLQLEVPVVSGTGEKSLEQAAGWISGTALPGSVGNAGIAAHRDTLFRPLKDVRQGDLVEWLGPHGIRLYRVSWTKIVKPKDVYVLDSTTLPALTLVSCYPFYFIGSAPYRFIVRAEAERIEEASAVRSTGLSFSEGARE